MISSSSRLIEWVGNSPIFERGHCKSLKQIIQGGPTRIFTIEELTSTKVGAIKAIGEKTVEHIGKFIVHGAAEIDTIRELATMYTTEVDCLGADEEGYSSVDEAANTSIADTQSYEVASVDDISVVVAIILAEAISNPDDVVALGGERGREEMTFIAIFIGSSSSFSSLSSS